MIYLAVALLFVITLIEACIIFVNIGITRKQDYIIHCLSYLLVEKLYNLNGELCFVTDIEESIYRQDTIH